MSSTMVQKGTRCRCLCGADYSETERNSEIHWNKKNQLGKDVIVSSCCLFLLASRTSLSVFLIFIYMRSSARAMRVPPRQTHICFKTSIRNVGTKLQNRKIKREKKKHREPEEQCEEREPQEHARARLVHWPWFVPIAFEYMHELPLIRPRANDRMSGKKMVRPKGELKSMATRTLSFAWWHDSVWLTDWPAGWSCAACVHLQLVTIKW